MNLLTECPAKDDSDLIDLGDLTPHKYRILHTNCPKAYDYGSTIEVLNREGLRLVLVKSDDPAQHGRYRSGGNAVDVTGNNNMRNLCIRKLHECIHGTEPSYV